MAYRVGALDLWAGWRMGFVDDPTKPNLMSGRLKYLMCFLPQTTFPHPHIQNLSGKERVRSDERFTAKR